MLLEALFTTLIIDSYEERDVATFDVTRAYLHADIPEGKTLLLKLRGGVVDIMCDINPEHKANVRYKRVQKFLYLSILRAVYGRIDYALQ